MVGNFSEAGEAFTQQWKDDYQQRKAKLGRQRNEVTVEMENVFKSVKEMYKDVSKIKIICFSLLRVLTGHDRQPLNGYRAFTDSACAYRWDLSFLWFSKIALWGFSFRLQFSCKFSLHIKRKRLVSVIWAVPSYRTALNPLCPHETRLCSGLPCPKVLRNSDFVPFSCLPQPWELHSLELGLHWSSYELPGKLF